MTSFLQKTFLRPQLYSLQLKRFRGKVNIQRPQKAHYQKALLAAVTKPIYKEPPFNEGCFGTHKFKLEKPKINVYQSIIAKETYNWFNQSQMIAILHFNSMLSNDIFNVRVALHKHNIHFKVYGRAIMQEALQNTKYENVLPLFQTKYCLLFSQEKKMKQLLKVIKKVPQMILLAGIVDNRLLSKNEFTELANLPAIDVMRAQFAALLDSIGGNQIVHNLEAHQIQLTQMLDAYAKSKDDEVIETLKTNLDKITSNNDDKKSNEPVDT